MASISLRVPFLTTSHRNQRDLVTATLRSPSVIGEFDTRDWELLIRQGRRGDLLGRVAAQLAQHSLLERVPPSTRRHLESALRVARKQAQDVRWEINRIQKALAKEHIPVIALKGAAYVIGGLPVSEGRVFGDVDILVPRSALPAVEAALKLHGWTTAKLDAYDQLYYRKWMHELPPFQHGKRETFLDVHHGIMPDTARLRPAPKLLWQSAVPVEGKKDLFTLHPMDMLLHSATHLFHDGELDHGLRDLSDLDLLFRHFGVSRTFWDALPSRAKVLNLERPLYYALRYCVSRLGTPVPADVMQQVDSAAPWPVTRWIMDFACAQVLRPPHPSCTSAFTPVAQFLLYIRGHWLRMPPRLLIPHLLRKLWRSEPPKSTAMAARP